MRLIHVDTHELRDFDEPPDKYAILSHRWTDEICLQDWKAYLAAQDPASSQIERKSGFTKIRNACVLAKEHGLAWLWADTVCIDKTNNLEVGKSINLMFLWYQSASVCFVFLHDVPNGNQRIEWKADPPNYFESPEWFKRGWTLQELLAPSNVLFFNKHWDYLGDRRELAKVINSFTRIPLDVLCGENFCSYSYADRFSWAIGRQTKEPEDRIYSLLGLLKVSLPAIGYGIGLKSALQQLKSAIEREREDRHLPLHDDELFAAFTSDIERAAEGML
jgi:hypothetical protein